MILPQDMVTKIIMEDDMVSFKISFINNDELITQKMLESLSSMPERKWMVNQNTIGKTSGVVPIARTQQIQ